MNLPPDPIPLLDLRSRIHLPFSSGPSSSIQEPASRIESRQDADDFTHGTKLIFALFLNFFILCIGGYYLAQ